MCKVRIMDKEEFRSHRADYNGICYHCGTLIYGDVEPDAENYECDNCGKELVYGVEQALIDGKVIIKTED